MAELAARRREARKNRILLNSEDRLKKVMGLETAVSDGAIDSSTHSKDTTSLGEAPVSGKIVGTFSAECASAPTEDISTLKSDINEWKDVSEGIESADKKIFGRDILCENKKATLQTEAVNEPCHDDTTDLPSISKKDKPQLTRRRLHDDAGDTATKSTEVKKQIEDPDRKTEVYIQAATAMKYLPIARLYLSIALAALIRISSPIGLGFLFPKSIVCSFIILELVILGYEKIITQKLPPTPVKEDLSLLLRSLILAGMTEGRVKMIGKTLAAAGEVTRDFSVFFFTFVTLNGTFDIIGF